MKLINENAKDMLFDDSLTQKISLNDYPYFYAKIMYRKGSLLKKEDYERLMKMDGPYEIADYLKKKTYTEAITALSATVPENMLIEAAMKYNTARECNEFIKYSRDYPGLNLILSALFKHYYLNNVKFFVLGKINNMDFEEIKQYLIPFGEMTYESFYSYYTRPSEADFFKSIKIDKKAKKVLMTLFKEKNTVEIQNMLDMYYYINLTETFSSISNKRAELRDYVYTIVGAKNIINVLKLKNNNIEKEKITGMLIPNRLSNIGELIVKLADSKDIDECFDLLANAEWEKEYRDALKETIEKKDIELLECLMEKMKLEKARKIFGVKNISAEVVVGYLVQKEIERKNILAISNGKKYNLNDEEIRQYLVI